MDVVDKEARLFELQALICQALSDPKRLHILYLLVGKELRVGELADALGVSLANVSQHLSILRARGLVRSRRDGSTVLYSLACPEIIDGCRALRAILSKQLAEDGEVSELLRQRTAAT